MREAITRWERLWTDHGFGPWIFRQRATGVLVGYAGLAPAAEGVEPGGVELLYALRPRFWGQGFAARMGSLALKHASSVHDISEVVAYTLDSNLRSQRVLQKLGFSFERHVVHAGRSHQLYRRAYSQRGSSA